MSLITPPQTVKNSAARWAWCFDEMQVLEHDFFPKGQEFLSVWKGWRPEHIHSGQGGIFPRFTLGEVEISAKSFTRVIFGEDSPFAG